MVSFNILAAFAGIISLSIAGHDDRLSQSHPSAPAEATGSVAKPGPAHAFKHVNAKRSDLGVYECNSHNWGGPCTWTKADGYV